MSEVVTCVYCGHEYPEGTPTAKAALLTEHISQCDKHPMSTLAKNYALVRSALVGLVGSDSREELEQMEATIRLLPVPMADKASTIDAINALMATLST